MAVVKDLPDSVLCIPLQAPLTTKDTAVLSGSLSTHNGNGGGTINLALRRVTSAKGWGEVCCSLSYFVMILWVVHFLLPVFVTKQPSACPA